MISIHLHHPSSLYGYPVILSGNQPLEPKEALRQIALEADLTQLEIADITGRGYSAICRYMSGSRKIPAEVFIALKNALGL